MKLYKKLKKLYIMYQNSAEEFY